MSKGVKKVLGIVAAIAVPFLAGPLAAAVGITSTFGTALVGAGLGAAAAGLTGNNVLLGAALGGLGTWAVGGGMGRLFGGGAAGATGTGAAAVTGAAPTAAVTAGATGGATGAVAGGVAPAVATTGAGTGGFLAGLKTAFTNPQNLLQLAMTVFGKAPQELTAIEQQRLKELEELSTTNRALFEQKVDAARSMIAQSTPNPEQAFANTAMSTGRALTDANRGESAAGLRMSNNRRAAIEGTRLGTAAVSMENKRAGDALATAAGMMPSTAPEGYAGLAMGIYDDLEKRRRAYYEDLSGTVGNMFGNATAPA